MARRKLKTIYIWGYTVILSPLKRKSIYGQRKIVAKNADDSECTKAYLSESGTEIYPKGSTSNCKIDKNGNAYVNGKISQDEQFQEESYCGTLSEMNCELYRFSPEGQELTLSSINTFCGEVTGIYTLEDFDQAELVEIIGDEVYRYNLATKKDQFKTSLVFQRNGIVFLLTYEEGRIQAAKRTSPPPVDDVPVYADLDKIDFEMF